MVAGVMTQRVFAACAKIVATLHKIEDEWRAELGEEDFAQLKALLMRVWESPLVR